MHPPTDLDAAERRAPLRHVPPRDGLVRPPALPVEGRVGDGAHLHLVQPVGYLGLVDVGVVGVVEQRLLHAQVQHLPHAPHQVQAL